MWWHISLGGGSLPACSTSMLRASQHHLHHQDATRICCTALPTVLCDFIKALAAVFTDMASAERFQLTYCFPSWAGFVATAGPRRLGLYWCRFHSKIRMSPWDAVTAAEHHAGLLSAHCRWRASLHREAPPAYLRISAITLVQASLIKPDALMWA